MLGRHHLSISIGTVLPFLIPLFFTHNGNLIAYSIVFLICVAIGSLTPDADCGGKSKLYYDFNIVYRIMASLHWLTVKSFKIFDLKKRWNLEHEVNKEHRGIMHAPVGILISSFFLTVIIIFVMLFIKEVNLPLILIIFSGLLIGQLLHSLEDSCTVQGINWKFPFGTKQLSGKIYTFEKYKELQKTDIRPIIFQILFYSISTVLILSYIFGKEINLLILYPLILISIAIAWILVIAISKNSSQFWHWDKVNIKEIKRVIRRVINSAGKNNNL